MSHYGDRCACCGESNPLFLSIDHISDAHHRQLSKPDSGLGLFSRLRRENYPSGYRVLCHNCNTGRSRNGGMCPHSTNQYGGTALYSTIISRDIVYNAYGSKCSCCGETNYMFLNIDHIDNDGSDDRKIRGSGHKFYKWLIHNNFPFDRYRLLCYNCNIGRARNDGICPHVTIS